VQARQRIPRRAVHGVLLLDKPLGLSSNDALQRAKRLYRAEKAGHTGTLDPLASGLLPICFALLLAVPVGLAAGSLSASLRGRWIDYAANSTALLGISRPTLDKKIEDYQLVVEKRRG